ncbi:hypothetical protein BJY01DRAFT_206451 [Aspergillus pseudoustus]|uniref:Secreted protein n=1 Tax=Aspergillus pseudoustus TaxID=1810923 RepID=A0ABR4KNG1_9EURO
MYGSSRLTWALPLRCLLSAVCSSASPKSINSEILNCPNVLTNQPINAIPAIDIRISSPMIKWDEDE